jgi:hypothetical protein
MRDAVLPVEALCAKRAVEPAARDAVLSVEELGAVQAVTLAGFAGAGGPGSGAAPEECTAAAV